MARTQTVDQRFTSYICELVFGSDVGALLAVNLLNIRVWQQLPEHNNK